MTAQADIEWKASLYGRFEAERTRAAIELLAAGPLTECRFVVDLGCGPGNSTALLVDRFQGAEVRGLDTSEDMLASARARLPSVRFEQGDVATWQPDTPVDLIFANAVLHWVSDHADLLPRLMERLTPGGVLAFQVPGNEAEPTHRLMRELAQSGPWAKALRGAGEARAQISTPAAYYGWLAPHASRIDLWQTTYTHVLPGPGAIVDWMAGAGLTPYLSRLDAADAQAFRAAYLAKITEAYPVAADGAVLLPFPRLFCVAVR
ncbi:MAG: trans-aconitate 2-methyltransferase [Pseudomonadota bacterium]